MNQMHQINSRQLMFIITGGQVGSAMLALPAFLSQEAGQHAWMCILLGALIPIINVLVIEKLSSRHSGLNLVGLFQTLLGRVGGTIAVLVFAMYLTTTIVFLANTFARLIKVFMLPKTPLWIVVLLAVVCVVYAGSKGGRVVGRINETLFFGMVLSVLFIVIPTYFSSEVTNLLPLGEIDAGELVRGAFFTIYTFAGTEILLVLYSQVDKPEEVKKAALNGVGLSVIIYLLVTISCLLVFGADRLVYYTWPGVTILKIAQVPVIERFEFYFLAFWVGIVIRRAINPLFAAALSLAQLFKTEERITPIILVLGAVVIFGNLLPTSVMLNIVLWNYASIAYLLIGFTLPLVLLIISWLRKGAINANVKA